MATILNPAEEVTQRIILTTDSAPELVIEIDIASPSLSKFPVFSSLCVREVWRYHKQTLTIFSLDPDSNRYEEQPDRAVLPRVTSEGLTRLIAEGRELRRAEWLRSVRAWSRSLC